MSKVIEQTYAALERLASSKLNALISAINAHDHAGAGGVEITQTKHLVWFVPEYVTDSDVPQSARIYLDVNGTITKCRLNVTEAPTDASLIVDIHLDNSSIWESEDRATLTSGNKTSSTTTFKTASITSGSYLDMYVDDVGDTEVGRNLSVELTFTAT